MTWYIFPRAIKLSQAMFVANKQHLKDSFVKWIFSCIFTQLTQKNISGISWIFNLVLLSSLDPCSMFVACFFVTLRVFVSCYISSEYLMHEIWRGSCGKSLGFLSPEKVLKAVFIACRSVSYLIIDMKIIQFSEGSFWWSLLWKLEFNRKIWFCIQSINFIECLIHIPILSH